MKVNVMKVIQYVLTTAGFLIALLFTILIIRSV